MRSGYADTQVYYGFTVNIIIRLILQLTVVVVVLLCNAAGCFSVNSDQCCVDDICNQHKCL